MRPALLAPAALLAATLCMSGAIAHSETADFDLSSEELGQAPIIPGVLLWLFGLGLSLWRWCRPVSKAKDR